MGVVRARPPQHLDRGGSRLHPAAHHVVRRRRWAGTDEPRLLGRRRLRRLRARRRSRLELAGRGQPDAEPRQQPGAAAEWRCGRRRSRAAPVLLAEGDKPAPSPDSRRVAFVRDGEIWAGAIGGAPPSRLFFARGENGSPAWSPDGRTLAFVTDRGAHSYIGLFSAPDAPIRYLAPSTSQDSRPGLVAGWAPRRVRPRPGRGGARQPPLEPPPQPWAIWVADVGPARRARSGGAPRRWPTPFRARWVVRTCTGSRATASCSSRIRTAGRTCTRCRGRRREALLLTPGDFMVEYVTMTPDRRASSTTPTRARTATTSTAGTCSACRSIDRRRNRSPPAPASSGCRSCPRTACSSSSHRTPSGRR